MILEILVSCMHQKNTSIVEKSGITTDVLIINQCDENDYQQFAKNEQTVRMISTQERGLSKSRNMAMKHAQGDICLFCDDDEELYLGYEQIILSAFQRLPDADIILFAIDNLPQGFRKKEYRLKYFDLFHAASVQIAYRKKSFESRSIYFHRYMGAGSGNGAQEENKFLIDCYKQGLRIYYVPQKIGRLCDTVSTWFQGYDETYFYQRGGSTRQMLGLPLSVIYAFYYVLTKKRIYHAETLPVKALAATLRGCFDDPIGKQMRQEKGEKS